MIEDSDRLSLPYIQPSQAQKHVTHNEALQRLDILVQASVQSLEITTPPGAPADGDAYVVGPGATGAWAGQDDNLTTWSDGVWAFFPPQPGWHVIDLATGGLRSWDGTNWIAPSAQTQNLDGIGINASSDLTNRLAVSSPATLLSHEGAGHQLKINKAADTDTASILFQDNWSGRAEMGLAGNDDFSVKVSSDGAAWSTALEFNSANATLRAKGLTTGTLTVANDSIGTITPPWAGGFIFVTIVDQSFPQSHHSAIVVFDTGPSPSTRIMSVAAHMDCLGSTILTGTTGTDGNSSLSAQVGQITIENRFGSARTYSYTFIGG
ncbi:MAG: DUF2793 domain-containing protein [Rhodobacteraceae bacterium]|nr:DUF2793 domain-containing protein [Paracoccaceae bacterium]